MSRAARVLVPLLLGCSLLPASAHAQPRPVIPPTPIPRDGFEYAAELFGIGAFNRGRGRLLTGAGNLAAGQGVLLSGAGNVLAGYGSYLHGGADVIRSQGEYMMQQQGAYLKREEYRQKRIQTRRLRLEQWLWEREHLPTPEDERQLRNLYALSHARNDPALTEIWSGVALNHLLRDAQKIRMLVSGADIPVAPEVLTKINVTSGKGGGHVGILKEGRILWPLLLRRRAFQAEREQVDQLVSSALDEAMRGPIDADILEKLLSTSLALQQRLSAQARATGDDASWSPTMYLDARHFLNDLEDALKVLQQPDAASFLNGKYALRGKTIGEVVAFLRDNGLEFAPASDGGYAAYRALHTALALYSSQGGAAVPARK